MRSAIGEMRRLRQGVTVGKADREDPARADPLGRFRPGRRLGRQEQLKLSVDAVRTFARTSR
jgi:hypothetical protein